MFKAKVKTVYVVPEFYKDWGNAQAELESLGRKLDAVRGIISDLETSEVPENHWGLRHWREVEAIVLRKWKHTLRLKDTGLRQKTTVQEGPKIDYSWWEKCDGVGTPVLPFFNFIPDWFNQRDLSYSWEKAMEQKLQKARQGLA